MRAEKIEVPGFDTKASRIEFCCVRCLYAIPLAIIGGFTAFIMMIIIGFFSFLNFFAIVILGKRLEPLYDFFVKYNTWAIKVGMYFSGVTDERPPLTPF